MSKRNDRGSKKPEVAKKASTFEKVDKVVTAVKRSADIAKGVMDFVKIFRNHPEWYTNYDTAGLLALNFARKRGTQYYNKGTQKYGLVSAAGIGVNLVVPRDNGGWQQGILSLYADIRSRNSGRVNYSVYDLEKYVVSVRSLHAAYAFCRKAYATLFNSSSFDSTTPMALFGAMGIDYTTFQDNAANFKIFGNLLGIFIENAAPLKIPLIDRTRWMFSNFFADSDDIKAVCYSLNPRYVPYASQATVDSTERIEYEAIALGAADINSTQTATTTGKLYNQVITDINKMRTVFSECSTFATIAGDILKAYGDSAKYPAESWAVDMPAPIIYDEAALTQIQNATLVGQIVQPPSGVYTHGLDGSAWSITDMLTNSGEVVPAYTEIEYLNMYKDSYTPGELLSATRFVTLANRNEKTNLNNCRSFGTEITSTITYVAYNVDSVNAFNLEYVSAYQIKIVASETDDDILANKILGFWSQMDWGPKVDIYVSHVVDEEQKMTYIQSLFDINNFAVINDQSQLRDIHSFADMSLLYAQVKRSEEIDKIESKRSKR
jgi:hypothetical protein